jgi:hypothetical protein
MTAKGQKEIKRMLSRGDQLRKAIGLLNMADMDCEKKRFAKAAGLYEKASTILDHWQTYTKKQLSLLR